MPRLLRLRSVLSVTLVLVALISAAFGAWMWVRATTRWEQWAGGVVEISGPPSPTPPPSRGFAPPLPPPAPCTQFWSGMYRRTSIVSGDSRLMLYFMHCPVTLENKVIPPGLAAELVWQYRVEPIDHGLGYNPPRGNVWIDRSDWNWHGIATWTTFQNGVSGRYFMAPYWALIIVSMVPAALVGGVVGARRLRAWRRNRRGGCVKCGYDMRGLAACPECGDSRGTLDTPPSERRG